MMIGVSLLNDSIRDSPVHTPLCKNISASLFTQITCVFLAVSSHRGAARDRHDAGRDAVDAGFIRRENVMAGQAARPVSDQTACGRMMCPADGEVVGPDAPTLASRRRKAPLPNRALRGALFRRRRWQSSPVTGESAKETV